MPRKKHSWLLATVEANTNIKYDGGYCEIQSWNQNYVLHQQNTENRLFSDMVIKSRANDVFNFDQVRSHDAQAAQLCAESAQILQPLRHCIQTF